MLPSLYRRSRPMMPKRPPMTTLRQRMHDDLQLRNYSEQTMRAYLSCVAAFARHFHPAPDRLGPEHVRAYQLYLVQQKKAAWSTFNQTVCALRFFYHTTLGAAWMIEHIPYPRHQKKLPMVLSRADVAVLLTAPRNLKHRAMLTTLYAAGLRVSELCALQVSDIESPRMVIRVRQDKGQRDRLVMLPPAFSNSSGSTGNSIGPRCGSSQVVRPPLPSRPIVCGVCVATRAKWPSCPT